MKFSNIAIGLLVLGATMLAGCTGTTPGADLNRVLDITMETMNIFDEKSEGVEGDAAMEKFADELAYNLNTLEPKVYPVPVGVAYASDGSFEGYNDENRDNSKNSGEQDLFKIEIDAENQRLIASDENNVSDHSFAGMGMGLLAGMLIGNMMSRQRAAGVDTKALSNKQTTARPAASQTTRTSSQSARSRAGSGSMSYGK